MAATIQYLGHSAFLIAAGEFRVLIDPFITGNPSAENAGIKADDLHPTHILLTHGHSDHVGDAPAIARRTQAQVTANFEVCEWLRTRHNYDNINPGNPGGRVPTSFGSVDFTHAIHSSSIDDGFYMGVACGLIIKIAGLTIYHAGDTALFSDMKLIGELHKPDVAILPVGDRFTMGPAHATLAAEWVGAKTVIPCHYNTWPPIEVDLADFNPKDIRVKALGAGDSIEV